MGVGVPALRDVFDGYAVILEFGHQQPSFTTILKLAQALNRSPGSLLDLVSEELKQGRKKK